MSPCVITFLSVITNGSEATKTAFIKVCTEHRYFHILILPQYKILPRGVLCSVSLVGLFLRSFCSLWCEHVCRYVKTVEAVNKMATWSCCARCRGNINETGAACDKRTLESIRCLRTLRENGFGAGGLALGSL